MRLPGEPDVSMLTPTIPKWQKKWFKNLRDQGCHVVVALTHIGYGEDLRMAEKVAGIDLILGGHSHTAVRDKVLVEGPEGWKTLVTQAGSMTRYVGVTHLVLEQDKVNLEKSGWELRELVASIPEDPRVVEALLPFQEKIEEELGKPFSTLTVDADARKAGWCGLRNPPWGTLWRTPCAGRPRAVSPC